MKNSSPFNTFCLFSGVHLPAEAKAFVPSQKGASEGVADDAVLRERERERERD